MKKMILSCLFIVLSISNLYAGSSYTKSYIKSNGSYVQGHYKSMPNRTRADNYTTRGNINPYTGSIGTKSSYKPYNPYR